MTRIPNKILYAMKLYLRLTELVTDELKWNDDYK